MPSSELQRIKIKGNGKGRKITCCYCNKVINRSILPHIKSSHEDKWRKWRRIMLDSFNDGLSPKAIMVKKFTVNGRYLFTWSVIEKEIRKMIEEGKKITPQVKKEIKKWEPKDFNLEHTTVWRFRSRGDWGPHSGNYRGNWSPRIPRNLVLQYSNEGDLIFDPFMGSGTTLVECRLLGRNAIGYDINPFAKRITDAQLKLIDKEAKRQGKSLPSCSIQTYARDARDLSDLTEDSVDLICAHPPYFNTLRYTEAIEGDLSRLDDVDSFLDEIESIARGFLRVLKPGRICAVLMGDFRKEKRLYPLGFKTETRFENAGFELMDTIIKEQYNDMSAAFYFDRGTRVTTHEYLYIFRKPVVLPGSQSQSKQSTC